MKKIKRNNSKRLLQKVASKLLVQSSKWHFGVEKWNTAPKYSTVEARAAQSAACGPKLVIKFSLAPQMFLARQTNKKNPRLESSVLHLISIHNNYNVVVNRYVTSLGDTYLFYQYDCISLSSTAFTLQLSLESYMCQQTHLFPITICCKIYSLIVWLWWRCTLRQNLNKSLCSESVHSSILPV